MIYDVNMDLTRKARLVTGGHLNDKMSAYMSYQSVVRRDSVHIGFMIDTMNDLDAMAIDVRNISLNEKPREKAYVKIGLELFGIEYEDRYASIMIELYVLRTSGTP